MNKADVAKFFKGVRTSLVAHSPEILTGIGIAGMITTTVLAVKATPKALERIEQRKQEEGVTKLKPKDVVKATWKCYIPTAVTGVASVACLIGASSVSARRNAALATAYKLSETALTEYRDKVVETIGEKKEQLIKDEIDKDRVKANPVSKNEVLITERGHTLCYDHWSKRYFYSDINSIKKAQNDLNERMLHDICGSVSLNDFYYELGLSGLEPIGDDMGWNTDKGLIDIHIGSCISDDGRPCIVVDHNNPPIYGF